MRNTRWIYNLDNVMLQNKYSKEVVEILYNRGIKTEEEIDFFINGKIENLLDPKRFSDMEIAVERVIKAIEKKEKIWIYGDYDVDGITSTSICYMALKELGGEVEYYIPLRDEGYGLNKDAISYIKDKGGNIIITVDCGISSREEAKFCKDLGMDMIITDHHEINDELPDALAVINPKREDNKDEYRDFSGVGTAFMLLLAIYEKLNRKEEMYKYLDIVAIGTIADIVPLKKYNRILVKYGLELLKSSKWLGLNMLIKKLFENPIEKRFDTYDVGFIIAPVFNAAGRLEDAKKAVELLIEKDHVICDKLIYELLNQNSERKNLQEKILEKVIEKIEENKLDEKEVIVVGDTGFHHGVIGIVASKVLDRFYKPTIILEKNEEEGIAKASCRSIEGFNIIEALNSLKELLLKYGGHAGAAGFSIEIDKIDIFYEKLNEYAKKNLKEEDKKKRIKIDSEISLVQVSYDLMEKLEVLEPYGFGNSSPIFAIKNCNYKNLRAIGKEKNHLMFDILKNNLEIKNCVWFNSEDILEKIVNYTNIDVAFKLKLESYKDKYQYKIFVEDIKETKNKKNEVEEIKKLYNMRFPIKSVFYTRKELEEEKIEVSIKDDEVILHSGKNIVGYLDFQTKSLLLLLNKIFGYEFFIKIEKKERKDENINVFVEIFIKKEFKSYALKKGEIFKDIKKYLIGDFEYNSIQKRVLNEIFIKNNKVILNIEKGRGVDTIIDTIKLFYMQYEKKVEVSKDIKKKNADFLIYLGENIKETDADLIITTKKIERKGYIYLEDKYDIPSNICLIEEGEIIDVKQTFFKENSRENKKRVIELLKKGEKIYATREIKIIL